MAALEYANSAPSQEPTLWAMDLADALKPSPAGWAPARWHVQELGDDIHKQNGSRRSRFFKRQTLPGLTAFKPP